jgi:hypothetical protein
MRRRDFIKVVGGSVTWPLTTHAQQARKPPIIGFLGTTSPAAWGQAVAAFDQRLHELVPDAKVFAALVNPKNANAQLQFGDAQKAAQAMGVQLVIANARA